MKRYLLAALATAILATSAHAVPPLPPTADAATSTALSAQGACSTSGVGAYLATGGRASVSIVVTGTFVGTLTFKAAADDKVTFNTFTVFPQAGGAGVTTATSTGTWLAASSAYKWVCAYFSAYTSGTATVKLNASVAPLSGGVGGAGSNVTQIGGASLALGSALSAASLPVVIASDQAALPLPTGAATAAKQPALGTAGTASADVITVQGKTSMTPIEVRGAAANGASISGNPLPVGIGAIADSAAPTAVVAGQVAYAAGSTEGLLYTLPFHPNHINCNVAVSTATTITAVGGSCATPGAGKSIYVTDIDFGSSVASSTAADSFPTLKYGTGGTCGAGTAVFWSALTAANTTQSVNLSTPIKIPANNEICWIHSVAGSKTVRIGGFIAP